MESKDPWDSLLSLEEQAFQEGAKQGAKESREMIEARNQGVSSGYASSSTLYIDTYA